ncbi:cell division protein FtsW [Gottschalkia acidurici 9a]|uniref:Cell division protein FtsW n=1 Tax=Gottschalkia acidurici (strain ATCC 7906 / DSM 604 / BCRC 14475 / CIP 104303 / KCTC 5404 / NCIMB 10678 / 9a) TaxID=1128398 RepID=K0B024_GOTA9|nr:FtsW/RodA/SpoVE family cell cycle protein [Gottschalkia acidurici]AFS77976.1 cell division protein FtsW [Gottschalkia acidurici 9a]
MIGKLATRTPQGLLVIINTLALILLLFYKETVEQNLIISIVIFMIIMYASNFILHKVSDGDNYLFLITSMLSSIGIIMIYRINPARGIRQIFLFGISIAAFYITYFIFKKIKKWDRYIKFYIISSLLLYLSTLIFGTRTGGALNWLSIGGFVFQPLELTKILYIFFIASYYHHREEYIKKYGSKTTLIFMAIAYAYIGFLFLQRELGIALLFFLVFNALFYVYEEDRKLILINLVGAIFMAVIGYMFFSHVRLRVDIWINPWKDIADRGYQITQSLFAIASGGFFGTGIGLGHPEFIPEVHTDFIFSAICEEMGVFAGIAIIMLFMIIVYRGIKITLQQENKFYRIMSLGITATIGFQAFIILGGVVKMIPLTGITLPFISYGGSSLVSSFISLAILQVASEDIELEQEDEHEHRVQKNN